MQVTLSTRISPELHKMLDEHSKNTGLPKAQIIATALKEYFEKIAKDK